MEVNRDKVKLINRQGEINMNGYVINTSKNWMHAMKRSVGPGAKVPLSELFEQYGIKHNLSSGEEFITWLKETKLKNKDSWRIVVEEDISTEDTHKVVDKVVADKVVSDKPIVTRNKKPVVDNVAPMVKTKMAVIDIVEMSVRQARESLPKITDLNLLKYAFQEANQRAGKDSLCRILRKRIK
jgi:hypothetical protein